jgi:hypothetical protein
LRCFSEQAAICGDGKHGLFGAPKGYFPRRLANLLGFLLILRGGSFRLDHISATKVASVETR